MEELDFIEDTHTYLLNKRKIPAVTDIMKFVTDYKYSIVPDSILENAQEKGTTVHFAVEVFNKTGFKGIDNKYKGYLDAYIKWINDFHIDRTKIESEVKTYNKGLNYAGTVDMIYNKDTIIDIKTTFQLDLDSVSVQTAAYKKALNNFDYKIKDCYVLRLKNDGNYEYIKLQDRFNIFLACLTLYNFINK
jgi:hypothetical protein